MFKGFAKKGTMVLSSVILALTVAACGQTQSGNNGTQGAGTEKTPEASAPAAKLTGEIKIDGSSTVFPISQAVAEEFMNINKDVNVSVGESGSSNGVKKMLAGEIDIADMSKKFKEAELEELKAKQNTTAIEMPVALDGITVVVNKKNTFATEMTVEELNKIWAKDSTVKKWNEIRPEWPDKEIKLYGPGTASGTFEFFTEAINGKAKESRTDYTPSEDDNVLVRGVAGDEFAMGYFGYAYYLENQNSLTAVAVKKDASSPAVLPSKESIESFTYAPLSRYIYIYPTEKALERTEVKEFIKYYMSDEGMELVESVGYIRLPQDTIAKNLEHVK